MDERGGIAAEHNVGSAEAKGIIRRQVIGRAVLIGNLRGENGDGAALVGTKVGVGVQREGLWTAAEGRAMTVAINTGYGEPTAGDSDRLVKGDTEIAVARDVDSAIGGCGAGDGRLTR